MKKAKKDRSLEEQLRDEMEAEAAKTDDQDDSSDSETAGIECQKSDTVLKETIKPRRLSSAAAGDAASLDAAKPDTQITYASSDDAYDTSDEETTGDSECEVKEAPVESEILKRERSLLKNQPMAVLRKHFRSCDARETVYSNLLKEKETIVARLIDVRKRAAFIQKTGDKPKSKRSARQDRAAYTRAYYKIPMNAVIRALNKEVDRLSKKPECHVIVEELFTVGSVGDEEVTPNMGHLCSLCKDYGAFSKFFDKKKSNKRSTCGEPSSQCKSSQARSESLETELGNLDDSGVNAENGLASKPLVILGKSDSSEGVKPLAERLTEPGILFSKLLQFRQRNSCGTIQKKS
ncbi:unnamed protein product [Nesidiocoris tenuis]|uniref:Uncharacterized protein n=1 Tax=Nesidiocoris tenuis TaxID=355587 RepID=A0A6H5GQF0_9HEMI|nr:unnamed protein product [Nesidiocoris tenuis]